MPGYPALWKTPFLDLAHTVWSMPEEFWIDDSPRLSDTELLKKEAGGQSKFDVGLRSQMVDRWTSGAEGVTMRVKVLPGRTRLLFLGTDAQWSTIPWKTWARIFQAIGHPVEHFLFYAHPLTREYPSEQHQSIEAANINAGYSYICQQHLVVVYRFEEATRVLLHELLHTACFDSELEVEELEANTEAWTEVFLCALLSKGRPRIFDTLWKEQTDWILRQTTYLQDSWNVRTKDDYAWRYTIGRHEVLVAKGFILKNARPKNQEETVGLRFTSPLLDLYIE